MTVDACVKAQASWAEDMEFCKSIWYCGESMIEIGELRLSTGVSYF